MKDSKKRVLVANITWNPSSWRNVYVNNSAGHSYAREHPGHESLNFDFNKKIDTKNLVYGYVNWTRAPISLEKKAIVVFYTYNLNLRKGQIVGIYGGAEIINPPIKTVYEKFENNILISNLSAQKDLSILFPIFLDSDKYSCGKRLVPQSGFTYKDELFVEKIIIDEINVLQNSGGIKRDEFQKLKNIYALVTGKEYDDSVFAVDEVEQEEIIAIDKLKNRQEIIRYLNSVVPIENEQIEYHGKRYKRDNKTIADIKIIRNFKCQICGNSILKKDGSFYIEAAHIVPKHKYGTEIPENILILCPNHHKEFDFGKRKVIAHDKEKIIFELNGKKYTIDISIDN